MLYEEYQSKMQSVAKVRKFFFRYRALFILAVAVCISLTAVLLGICGVVSDATNCPTSFVYGQDITYSANAIMGDVAYQYFVNGAWTDAKPTTVGTYEVRAVSKNVFGKTTYGETHTFTIVPTEIDLYVDKSELVYGDTPVLCGKTNYEDYIVCNDFSYGSKTDIETTVKAVERSVHIFNKDNEDVTTSYHLNIIESRIKFLKRPITFAIETKQIQYNAKVLTYDAWQITNGNLADGDRIVAVFDKSLLEVGEIDNIPSELKVLNSQGTDVSYMYDIVENYGKLIIDPRVLVVDTNDVEKYYDGTPLVATENDYTLSASTPVAEGETLIPSGTTQITNVGSEDNIISFEVKNSAGERVTTNYTILVGYGKIKVNPRPITVVSDTNNAIVYNGTYQSDENYIVDEEKGYSILAKDKAIVTQNTLIKYFGDEAENVIAIQILDENDNDNSSNYAISYEFGTIAIAKREIKILSNTNDWYYDDLVHSDNSLGYKSDYQVVSTQQIVFNELATIKDVGSCENRMIISVFDGDEEVTPNYDITYEYGTLTIYKRDITITTNSSNKIYDGTPLSDIGYSVNKDFVAWHTVTVIDNKSITNKGTLENTFDVTIFSGEDDVSENYNLEWIYGTLEILARPLVVKGVSNEFEFDDEDNFDTQYSFIEGTSLAANQQEYLISHASVRYVTEGLVTNEIILGVKIKDEDTLVTDNYNITYKFDDDNEYGTISIYKRAATLTADDATKIYDDEALSRNSFSFSRILSTHLVSANITSSETNVGVYFNSIDEASIKVIRKVDSVDLTDNYSFTCVNGTLTINARPITFYSVDNSWIYDAIPHSDTNISNYTLEGTDLGLLESKGHEIALNTDVDITAVLNVSDTAAENNRFAIKILKGSDDISNNYAISYEYGTLTINPRPVTVTTASNSWVYDAQNHYDLSVESATAESVGVGLITGQVVVGNELEPYAFVKEVKDTIYNNNEYIAKFTAGDVDVTENYTVTYVYGTLSITERPISVTTKDHTWTYDDEEHSDLDIDSYTTESAGVGLVSGHTIAANDALAYAKVLEVKDTATNNNIYSVIIKEGDEDVTENYDISYTYGSLTIEKRDIVVTANSATKYYDATPLTENGCVASNLAKDSHYAKATAISGTVTDFADSPVTNTITAAKIYKMANEVETDLSDNYNITSFVNGTLTIVKRPIKVTTPTESWYYDDEDHSNTDDTIFEIGTYDEAITLNYADSPIVGGQEPVITNETIVHNVSDTANNNNTFTLAIKLDSVDKTSNYEIEWELGTLTINKRPITIITGSASKYYDNTALTSIAFTNDTTDEKLPIVTGHTFTPVALSTSTITDVLYNGETVIGKDNEFDSNACTITRDLDSVDVTANYDITFVNGTLTINPRPITIHTSSETKVYDATPLSGTYTISSSLDGEGIEILSDSPIVSGEHATITLITLTNADIIDNSATSIKVYKDLGETIDSTSNYAFTYDYGTLTVTKRPLVIKTPSTSWVYDDTTHYDTACIDNSVGANTGLISGHQIKATEYATIKTPGTKQNIISTYILDAEDNGVTNNYDISYKFDEDNTYGTLTVTRRPVSVAAVSKQKIYDGTPLTTTLAVEAETTGRGLLTVHSYIGSANASITNVGTTTEFTTDVKFYYGETYSEETDVTDYYDITLDKTYTLEVLARPITIQTGSTTTEFNYESITYNVYSIVVDEENSMYDLADGQEIDDSNLTYTITNGLLDYIIEPGTATNTLDIASIKIYSGETEIDISNYDITVLPGTITVTKRHIEIISYSNTFVYNDEDFACYDYVKIGSFAGGDDVEVTPTIVHDACPNGVDNVLTLTIRHDDLDVTSLYYDITYPEYGKLVVQQRPIKITSTGSYCDFYDGLAHDNTTYTIEETVPYLSGLIPGHSLVIKSAPSIQDVYFEGGEVSAILNVLEFEVMKEGVVDPITSNYQFTFGTYGTLKVKQREVLVTTSTPAAKVYDGTPLQGEYELSIPADVEGQVGTILASEFEVITLTSLTNVGMVDNSIEIAVYKDEEHTIDSTSNYHFTYNLGTLTVTKRPLNIVVYGGSWVYDGTPQTNRNITYANDTSLAPHQSIGSASFVTVTNVWDSTDENPVTNDIDLDTFAIVDLERADVTKNYDITISYSDALLTITKRTITIVAGSAEKEYDGTPLTCSSFTIENGVEADYAVITCMGSQTNIGSSQNVVSGYKLYSNATGIETTSNYIISKSVGQLTVTKISITLSSGSKTWTLDPDIEEYKYDNFYISPQDQAKIDNLGHILTHTVTGVILKANAPGQAANTFTYDITDGENSVLATYYDVTTENGMLIVIGAKIYIESSSKESSLDKLEEDAGGKYLAYDNYKYAWTPASLDHELHVTVTGKLYYDENLLLDGKMSGANTFTWYVIDKADSVTSETEGYIFYAENLYYKDVTSVYSDSELVLGELTIYLREIHVMTSSDEKYYDGTPLTNDTIYIDGDDLIEGHKIITNVTGSQTEIGESPNTFTCFIVDTLDAKDTETSGYVYDAEDDKYYKDVTDTFYYLMKSAGTLVVKAYELEIKTGTSVVSGDDDTELSNDEYTIDFKTKMHEDDQIGSYNIDVNGLQLGIGSSANTIDPETLSWQVLDANGQDISAFYTLVVAAGALTVLPLDDLVPKVFTIKPIDEKEEYNGEELVATDYVFTSVLGVAISEDMQLETTLLLQSQLHNAGYNLVLTYGGSIVNVGTEVSSITSYQVLFTDEDDVTTDATSAFTITTEEGVLEVIPREITIKSGNVNGIYNGEPQASSAVTVIDGSLAPNETVQITPLYSVTFPTSEDADNIFTYEIIKMIDSESQDYVVTTSNYNVRCEYGKLHMERRMIYIKTKSATKPYDGIPLTMPEWEYKEFANKPNSTLLPNHELIVTVTGSQTEIGKSDNTAVVYVVDTTNSMPSATVGYLAYEDEEHVIHYYKDVTEYYNPQFRLDGEYECGQLEITEKIIKVTTGSKSKSYDGTILDGTDVSDYSGDFEGKGYVVTDTAGLDEDKYIIYVELTGQTPSANCCNNIENTANVYVLVKSTASAIQQEGFILYEGMYYQDISSAFEMEVTTGSLAIFKRMLYIETPGGECFLDECPLSRETYNHPGTEGIGNGLLPGHYIVGAYDFTVVTDVTSPTGVPNRASFIIYDAESNPVSQNYQIDESAFGKLIVTKRNLYIETSSKEIDYVDYVNSDDKPLTTGNDDISITYTLYDTEHSFNDLEYTYSYIAATLDNPGSIKNFGTLVIYNALNEDITDKFNIITDNCGKLTINSISFTITTADNVDFYDPFDPDKTLTADSYTITEGIDAIMESLGHKFSISVTGAQIGAGSSHNTFEYSIVDINDTVEEQTDGYIYDADLDTYCKDVSNLYSVREEKGSLELVQRALIIQSGGNSKVYDGTPLTSNEIETTSILGGTEMLAKTFGDATKDYEVITSIFDTSTITKAGTVYNEYDYAVIDPTDTKDEETDGYIYVDAYGTYCKDVSALFDITPIFGNLTVTPKEIVVTTGSASKDLQDPNYDGNGVTSDYITVEGIISTDSYEAHTTGIQTIAGASQNTYEITITNSEDEDVSDCYVATNKLGILGLTDGPSSLTPDLRGSMQESDGNATASSKVIMQIYSDDYNGQLYLKAHSYNTYTGTSWSNSNSYSGKLTGNYSYDYLAGSVLGHSSYNTEYHTQILSYMTDYMLPYYLAMDGEQIQGSDNGFTGDTSDVYNATFYNANYDLFNSISRIVDYDISAYTVYVYENYGESKVPAELKTYLQGVISTNHLSNENIAAVVNYIKNCASYKLDYNSALDEESDMILAFMRDYKEGVCRHYASAATMLFRTLGIPARFCTGVTTNVKAGRWNAVTAGEAHAWVEIFINGLGWVQLEVTGEGEGGGGGEDDPGHLDFDSITLKPKDVAAHSTSVVATELEENAYTLALDAAGYEIIATFGGVANAENPTAASTITSLIIRNKADANDVLFDSSNPSLFDLQVNYEVGVLEYTNVQLRMTLIPTSFAYDGTPKTYYYYPALDKYFIYTALEVLGEGTVTSVVFDMNKLSLTNVGQLTEEQYREAVVAIYNGVEDVTDQYYLVIAGEPLTVTQRALTIATSDASFIYIGTPHTCNTYEASGLATGDYIYNIDFTASIIDVGSEKNTINTKTLVIKNANGDIVTDNYLVTVNEGTITVTD